MPSDRKYWAHPFGDLDNKVGPHETREQAATAAFAAFPDAKEVTTGYGTFGPFFDIRWIKREER